MSFVKQQVVLEPWNWAHNTGIVVGGTNQFSCCQSLITKAMKCHSIAFMSGTPLNLCHTLTFGVSFCAARAEEAKQPVKPKHEMVWHTHSLGMDVRILENDLVDELLSVTLLFHNVGDAVLHVLFWVTHHTSFVLEQWENTLLWFPCKQRGLCFDHRQNDHGVTDQQLQCAHGTKVLQN